MSETGQQRMPLCVHFTPGLDHEQEAFWEALGWVREHFSGALGWDVQLTGQLVGPPVLPEEDGAVIAVFSAPWQLAGGEGDDAQALLTNLLNSAAAGGRRQVYLYFQGLTPEQARTLDVMPPRLSLKQKAAAGGSVLARTFDTPKELRRQFITDLLGTVERKSRGVNANHPPGASVTFPEPLLKSLQPVRVEVSMKDREIDPLSAARSLASSALAAVKEGQLVEADLLFLEALATADEKDVLTAWAWFLTGTGRIARAAQAWRKVIALAQDERDGKATAVGFLELARAQEKQGQPEAAAATAREAVQRFSTLPASAEKAAAGMLLGDLLLKTRKSEEAGKAYDQALHHYEQLGDANGQAQALLKIGQAHQRREELEEADKRYNDALHRLDNVKNVDERILARVYVHKGSLDSQRKMYAMAEKAYERASALFNKLEDLAGLSDTAASLGKVALLRNQPSKSLLLLRCAMALDSSVEDYEGLGMDHMSMGVLKGETGNRREALRQFKAARGLFELAGAAAKLSMVDHLLKMLEEEKA